MVTVDLEGQSKMHENVDIWENYSINDSAWGNENNAEHLKNPQYQLRDDERKIYTYQSLTDNISDFNIDTQLIQINVGSDNASAVDAFVNVQMSYDFYKKLFNHSGLKNGEPIEVTNNVVEATIFKGSLINNAAYLNSSNRILQFKEITNGIQRIK